MNKKYVATGKKTEVKCVLAFMPFQISSILYASEQTVYTSDYIVYVSWSLIPMYNFLREALDYFIP